jgi:integrase
MGTKWRTTKYPGIRFREHATRRHGVVKDRYFSIRYQRDGRRQEEALGWASEGWTAEKAALQLAELKKAALTGEGPARLAEKREAAEAEKQARKKQEAEEKKAALTFGEIFKEKYLPHIRQNRRNPQSAENEETLFRLWVAPVIENRPLAEIAPLQLEKIKSSMLKAGKAPRTVRYALEMIRQVFNYAERNSLFDGANPVKKINLPSPDNRRMRFLSREEAEALLKDLANRSKDTHDMAALSLYAGLRFGEITALQWADVDIEQGILLLRDTKSGKTRAAFMNDEIKAIFESRPKGIPASYVFPDKKHGGRIGKISSSFLRAVNKLGLNEGIEDQRQKFTFQGLRHTFASWLVQDGTDLFTVKELLGHADYAMAIRYSHMGAKNLRSAVNRLSKPRQAEVVSMHDREVMEHAKS